VDQRLIEMSPVRVVVAVDWLGAAGAAGSGNEPLVSFRYTIYPTGQIYTYTRAHESTKSSDAPVGVMISLASAAEADVQVETQSLSGGLAYLGARHVPGNALLAFVPAAESRLVHKHNEKTRQLALVAYSDSPEASLEWASQVYVGNLDSALAEGVRARALAYAKPPALEFLIGAPGEAGAFDAAGGCYRVKPDGDRVRFRMKGREGQLFAPAFCVEGAGGKRGWVYLKHLIHQPVATASTGDLVFQLPGEVRENQLVEVVLEASPKAMLP
jgi:hypothetical protein